MKEGAVIWVHELLRTELRADGVLTVTFSIIDPVTAEPHSVDVVFPKDEAEGLRDTLGRKPLRRTR